jgi:hypothetical protein
MASSSGDENELVAGGARERGSTLHGNVVRIQESLRSPGDKMSNQESIPAGTVIKRRLSRQYNRKYVIGSVSYRRWQSLLLLLLPIGLISSGNGVAIVLGVALVVALILLRVKSKVVMTPQEREAARHRLESRMIGDEKESS